MAQERQCFLLPSAAQNIQFSKEPEHGVCAKHGCDTAGCIRSGMGPGTTEMREHCVRFPGMDEGPWLSPV